MITSSFLVPLAIALSIAIIFGLIIKIVNYQFHSNLKILGLDVLTPSGIEFVVKDNLIHLMVQCSVYDEPCYRTKEFAKLIGAELKIIDTSSSWRDSKKIEWYKDGKLILTTAGHYHILLTPTGEVVKYDKQKRFSLNYGEKPLDAILRSADNGQFELKILNSGAYHHYEVIDTYDWSKH